MPTLPVAATKLDYVFVIVAVLAGIAVDQYAGDRLDYWIHDAAVVYQARKEWKHSAIVVLDEAVPHMVGRKQALPLFALATDRLIEAGAQGVFMDASISKEIESRMPYARCIEHNGDVRWSMPGCTVTDEKQCFVENSAVGNAPLKMSQQAIKKFSIAPYFKPGSDLPDFLLYGWEAAESVPQQGLQVSDRLVTRWSPLARWIDLSHDNAVYRLVSQSVATEVARYFHDEHDQTCNGRYACRRVRLSRPLYRVQTEGGHLIMPVSQLASCDHDIALKNAASLKNKVVILQTTAPTEQTDRLLTPMTTALFGPGLLTPGSQYIADEVETIVNRDHPIPPTTFVKLLLFLLTGIASVAVTTRKPALLWPTAVAVVILMTGLCFLNPRLQLWPFFATMLVYFTGAGQAMTVNLIVGLKEGRLIKQYMPKQIHNLLLSLKEGDTFQKKRCRAVVLMSDLAGYTTLTGLLKEPSMILDLMNDYLSETAIVLQDKYNGWFESYIGDMVCYYWPYDGEPTESFNDAVSGAVELARLQKEFFTGLSERYASKLDEQVILQINRIINAGIGLTVGHVVMGDLGPQNGIRKFGILGDPLNLAARIESLTRLFNTEIIVTGAFLEVIKQKGLPFRRLGLIKVKGRIEPEMLYALGDNMVEDPRFERQNIALWEHWLQQVELGETSEHDCPSVFSRDKETIMNWKKRNLLGCDKVWYLDEK